MASSSVPRDILRIAVPVSLEMVVQLVLGFTIQVIVGRLGALAVAAVGFANSLNLIGLLSLATLGSGSAILVARAFGAANHAEIERTVSTAEWLAVAGTLAVSIPAALLARPFLELVGAPPDVAREGVGYFRVLVSALPFVVLSAVASGAMRSLEQARLPMLVMVGAAVMNVALAYVLVTGPGPLPALGLTGAAVASLASQLARALVLLTLLHARPGLVPAVRPGSLGEFAARARQLLTLTFPLFLTQMSWSLGTFLYALLFARLGTGALAGSQIVNMMEGVFVMASAGLMSSATTLIGQAVGAGDHHLARRWAGTLLRAGLGTGAAFGLLFFGAAFFLAALYPRVGPETLQVAFWGIAINAAFQFVKVRNMIQGGGILPSGGDTRGVLLGDATAAFLVGLPLAYLLGFALHFGVLGLFWARILEEVAKSAIFALRARRLSWKQVTAQAWQQRQPQEAAEAA